MQRHVASLKKQTSEQLQRELMDLQAANNALIEAVRASGLDLRRRSERLSQQQALFDEVHHVVSL